MNERNHALDKCLTIGMIRKIYSHARSAYPDECCGMILRSGLRRCDNIQNHLHGQDPIQFPHTARKAFAIDAAAVIFLIESLETDDPVVAVYHSHTDGSLSFSQADRSAALYHGKPLFPELVHLVIGCRSDRIVGAALFQYCETSFRQIARFDGMPL